jgi:hypothetical protein
MIDNGALPQLCSSCRVGRVTPHAPRSAACATFFTAMPIWRRWQSNTARSQHSVPCENCCDKNPRGSRSGRKVSCAPSANIAGGSAQQVNALLQAGVFDFIAHDVGNCGADEDAAGDAEIIRHESQRIVVNGLRNASDEDRIAIIGSASFRALLTAASSQQVGFAGLEGIDLVLKQTFGNTAESTTLLPGARLSLLVEILARSNGERSRLCAAASCGRSRTVAARNHLPR